MTLSFLKEVDRDVVIRGGIGRDVVIPRGSGPLRGNS